MGSRGLVMVVLAGCGRIGFDAGDGLVVTRTDDRLVAPNLASLADLPPGTVGLSLREAMTIANGHAGPDRITFDPTVFPASIRIESLLVASEEMEIDATGRGVVLDVGGGYTSTLVSVAAASVTLRGLQFAPGGVDTRLIVEASCTGAALDALAFATGPQPITVEGANVTITDVQITGSSANGIAIDGAADVTIDGASIAGVFDDPILVRNSSNVDVTRATIQISDKTVGRGIRVESSTSSHFHDNIIDPGPAQLISLQDSSDNEIVSNVLDGGTAGIALFGTSSRNLVFRNATMNNVDDSVYIDPTATQNRIFNTTIINAPAIADLAPDTQIANTFTATAEMVLDAGGYDFHVPAGSPAIDQGTDLGLDMLPELPERFLGAAPDLGCAESF